jgi:hypothetical protein
MMGRSRVVLAFNIVEILPSWTILIVAGTAAEGLAVI